LQDAVELVPLLRPFPADAMRAYPVGSVVNNPRNDGPGCLELAT
jgi:putative SOS response-associated peptidase YedK